MEIGIAIAQNGTVIARRAIDVVVKDGGRGGLRRCDAAHGRGRYEINAAIGAQIIGASGHLIGDCRTARGGARPGPCASPGGHRCVECVQNPLNDVAAIQLPIAQ